MTGESIHSASVKRDLLVEEYGLESSSAPTVTDVLRLNVGGTRCQVLRKTLCQIEHSMLANCFSGKWDSHLDKDQDGNFFIDQPFELFKPLLDYLRSRAVVTTQSPPLISPSFNDRKMNDDFIRMVEYYGCTPGIFPTKLELHRGIRGTEKIASYPELGVKASKWSTFLLKPEGHERQIQAFEVILGKVERFLVGWANPNFFHNQLGKGNWAGVGEEAYSISLDCSQSAVLFKGHIWPLATVNVGEGDIIRCHLKERRWFVNKKVVASHKKNRGIWENIKSKENREHYNVMVPAFSGKGEWKITDVVLSYEE